MLHYPRPPFPDQHQPMPGKTAAMNPTPDHGETSYKGSGRLNGKKAIITGGDSGIGRAVAIAYAREGADVLISYLDEHDDARETERLVKEAGRKAVLLPGDVQEPGQCRAVIAKAVSELGGIDILVNKRGPSGKIQINRRDQRRGMGTDVQGEHPRDVLSHQGCGRPHEAR
jgi:NAD(P)-dependent dehydrogenase (short-subunit alcohol dehydrogenase family)